MKIQNVLVSIILVSSINSCSPKKEYSVREAMSLSSTEYVDNIDFALQLQNELKAREQVPTYIELDTVTIVDSLLRLSDEGILFTSISRSFQPSPEFSNYSTDTLKRALNEVNKVIYSSITDGDGRIEYYQESEHAVSKNADGVAALFMKSSVEKQNDGTSKLLTTPFIKYDNVVLCGTENFKEQPKGAFCTGFAISKNLIVTAGHCLTAGALNPENFAEGARVVFGFRLDVPNLANTIINNQDIYKPKRVVKSGLTSDGIDFAVIEVEGEIPNEQILKVESESIRLNDSVYVIGHPAGLPLKIAKGAQVRQNEHNQFFVADLDTYGGNSGSPVFTADNKVVGILVRGAVDFLYSYESNCYESNKCPVVVLDSQMCGGESVSRTSQFINYINP